MTKAGFWTKEQSLVFLFEKYYWSRFFFHSSKCDTDFDCHDKSDEYYCDYLFFGENYAKELIPRDETGRILLLLFFSIDSEVLKSGGAPYKKKFLMLKKVHICLWNGWKMTF